MIPMAPLRALASSANASAFAYGVLWAHVDVLVVVVAAAVIVGVLEVSRALGAH